MALINQDLVIFAGDTVYVALSLSDADGAPLNLSNLTLLWGLGPLNAGPATLLKTSTVSGQIDIDADPTTGFAILRLVPADTVALRGTFRQELKAIDASGAVETLMTGRVVVSPSSLQPVPVSRLRVVSSR